MIERGIRRIRVTDRRKISIKQITKSLRIWEIRRLSPNWGYKAEKVTSKDRIDAIFHNHITVVYRIKSIKRLRGSLLLISKNIILSCAHNLQSVEQRGQVRIVRSGESRPFITSRLHIYHHILKINV